MIWLIQINNQKMWLSKNNESTDNYEKALKFDSWIEARLKAISMEMNNLVVISNFSLSAAEAQGRKELSHQGS